MGWPPTLGACLLLPDARSTPATCLIASATSLVPQVLLALCRCAGPDTRRRFYQLSLLDSLLQELRLELDMFCDMVGAGRGCGVI